MTSLINLTLPVTLIDAVIGAGSGEVFALPARACILSWQTSYNSAPSGVNISLQVSIDGVNFTEVDSSTDTAGEVRVVDTIIAANFIKAVTVTDTGGKEVTVTLLAKENP